MKCDFCGKEDKNVTRCKKVDMYLCSKHRHQLERHGKLIRDEERVRACEACGVRSDEKAVHWCAKAGKYLCGKHRNQINRLGYLKERTKRDKNLYVIHEDYAEILFENSDGSIICSAYIDVEDVDRCMKHKWFVTEFMGNTRYVKSSINKHNVSLHRYILSYKGAKFIDHANRNGLDNRKSNLRILSPSENSVNSKTRSITGEKNIYRKKDKYQVLIVRNYKKVFIKTFSTLEEAIIARDSFIKDYNKSHKRAV